MNINNELGINLVSDYYTEMGYENAGGRGKAKVKNFFKKVTQPITQPIKHVTGTLRGDQTRPSQEDMDKANAFIENVYGGKIFSAKTLDELDEAVGSLADEKAAMEIQIGKRKSGVGRVLSMGRQYKRSGKNASICSNNSCVRESKARLAAIETFETRNKTKIDGMYKKLTPKDMPPPAPIETPTPSGGAPLPPTPSTTPSATMGEMGGATAENAPSGGILQGEVNIGGKPVKKSYIGIGVGVLAVAAIGYYFIRKG